MANVSYWHTFWVDPGETGLLLDRSIIGRCLWLFGCGTTEKLDWIGIQLCGKFSIGRGMFSFALGVHISCKSSNRRAA
jgi:hypothetical protein